MTTHSPTYDLQTGLYTLLSGVAALTAYVGTRIHDHVPNDVAFPYIEFGEFQELDDSAQDIDGSEVAITLHVWDRPNASGPVGRGRIQRIVDLIRQSVDEATFSMADHHMVSLSFESARYMKDPDGLTTHAVVQVKALTEAD
jgi:hypothetical protein